MSKLLPWQPKEGDYWSLPFPTTARKLSLKEHVEKRTREHAAVFGTATKSSVLPFPEVARAMGYPDSKAERGAPFEP